MAEKSGFFNALNVGGEYDRTYNADDYSENLAVVISSGVLRSKDDDLKVTANGMVVSVGKGRAWINGHYYFNDTDFTFTPTPSVSGGSRIDSVILRFDNNISYRDIHLEYRQGTVSNSPTPPTDRDIFRNETVYELVLANIYVSPDNNITVVDTRGDQELCGWVYSTSGDGSFFTSLDNSFNEWFTNAKDNLSSVTLFKKYTWETTLISEASSVQFEIPQYRAGDCFIEVYVNGSYDDDYTLENNVVTFDGTLIAGTNVVVNCYKSIDGTDIMSVADEITQLQNRVEAIDVDAKYSYKCTGFNDNLSISQIAKALAEGSFDEASCTPAAVGFLNRLGGNDYLANLYPSAQITVEVIGRLGMSTAFLGSGTEASPYTWIATSSTATPSDRKIVFDFAKCEMITHTVSANSYNNIFSGLQVNIRNANVKIYSAGGNAHVTMINCVNNGRFKCNVDNSYLEISVTGNARISAHGNFTNCDCYIVSQAGSAYCFKANNNSFVRVNGGTFLAYGETATGIGSAIFHTSASEPDAVTIAQNIHCPIVRLSTFSQGFLSVGNGGSTVINTVVSRLTSSGNYNTIENQIQKNKA